MIVHDLHSGKKHTCILGLDLLQYSLLNCLPGKPFPENTGKLAYIPLTALWHGRLTQPWGFQWTQEGQVYIWFPYGNLHKLQKSKISATNECWHSMQADCILQDKSGLAWQHMGQHPQTGPGSSEGAGLIPAIGWLLYLPLCFEYVKQQPGSHRFIYLISVSTGLVGELTNYSK